MLIETKRLLLRKPILEDFEEYWLMKNDKAATMYTGGMTPYSYEERLEMFRKEWVEANQNTEFSITIKANNEYIGYCGLVDENELLYGLKQSAWQKGYGFEAAKAALHYGFTALRLPYIVATVSLQNVASEKILKKVGMAHLRDFEEPGTGILREYRLDADPLADSPSKKI